MVLMNKTSTQKREKILIILASLAVLYLVIDFLVLPSRNDQQLNTSQPAIPSAGPADVSGQLMALTTSRKTSDATEILALAGTPWPSAVFVHRTSLAEPKAGNKIKVLDPDTFEYSGYMDMGASRLAIINGRDYQQNDTIEGYTLLEISPLHIILGKDGSTFRVLFKAPKDIPEIDPSPSRPAPLSRSRRMLDES